MCTVSYIPKINKNGFLLTSNRDEKHFRKTYPPMIYDDDNIKLSYPKDVKAGGSWIAINNNGRVCCLLNGAFLPHQKLDKHTQSRGKILLESVSYILKAHDYFEQKNLFNVEPFTIITHEQDNGEIGDFSEFIWDGKTKHHRKLDKGKPYIWSSVTLYNEETRNLRQNWFNKFLNDSQQNLSTKSVYQFHAGSHSKDDSINLIMKREDGLKTVSITQIESKGENLVMKYNDLLNSSKHTSEL